MPNVKNTIIRSPTMKARDHRIVSDMYLKGYLYKEIAEAIGRSIGTVHHDVKALIQGWKESSLIDINERMVIELERINHLEKTYWEGWERSIGESVTEVVKAGKRDKKDFKSVVKKKEMKVLITWI